jgi:serine-type D-Ala-D-Ala carboxypeptidase (penicillin-binding protein 5/6)
MMPIECGSSAAAQRTSLLVMPAHRGFKHAMRLTARIVAVTAAVTVLGGGIAAWAATGTGPGARSASELAAAADHAAAVAHRSRAPAARPRPPAGPVIQVTGAPQGVKAKGAVLADALTGQVLWSRGLDTERPMASVTKVMTALLVLQGGHLDQVIRVPQAAFNYAWKYGGETASLRPGDELTVQDLLEALLLPSGADAAYTLANAYGPGMNAFIARMNATAAQMGMTHTHFTSPDGLPYPTETSTYSTPADLLTLGLAAMRFPVFRSIVSLQFFHLPKGPGHHEYWWYNTNALIGSYQGAVGIKDGYTDDAGHCLLFEAVRNGRTLIGVVLGSPATGVAAGAHDAAQMLNWGFSLKQAPAA